MKRFKKSFSFLFFVHVLATCSRCSSEEITMTVSLKKPIATTDEKFLSLTIDPLTLLAGNALSADFERSINLAKALTPAYVRLGGPHSSFYGFSTRHSQDNSKVVLSESDWILSHQWAQKAGLDVIACIAPGNRARIDNSEDATEIVSFSDHMNFNANWQLGYECQSRCNLSASDFAKQTVSLRKILNEFPRYSKSIISGPDVVAHTTEKQRKYLRDYLSVASSALSAITWHPNLASATLGNDGAFIHQDNLESDKEELLKIVGRFVEKKPLWIAESKTEESKNFFIGALVLARRLGNAAKANINVILRQPTELTQPTPDYWVALLHKTLVGQKVFDAKVQPSKKDRVYLFCQCARASYRYEKGSIMIFGVNLSPESVEIVLKGSKIITAHQYVLSAGFDAADRMFSEIVLLNNHSLALINDTVPNIYPEILSDPTGLNLHLESGDIGFWVIPHIKVKACMEEDDTSKSEPLSGSRITRNPKKAEDLKAHVIRSVKDRAWRNERRRQRSDTEISKSNVKRELRMLKKFVRRKLDDYESKSLLQVRGLYNSKEEKGDVPVPLQDDMQSRLLEYKDRFLRFIELVKSGDPSTEINKSVSSLMSNAASIMSKIVTTIDTARKETDYENRIQSSESIKESLKALYDLLANIHSNFSADSREQESKRTKRDLLAEGGTWNAKRGSVVRKRSRNDHAREARGDRKIKRKEDIRKEIQPSMTSGENTFYGFFQREPVAGFPQGDVYFATEDSENSRVNTDFDYEKDGEPRNREVVGKTEIDRTSEIVVKKPVDYAEVGSIWEEDENDYPFYEHAEHVENARPLSDRAEEIFGSSAEIVRNLKPLHNPLETNFGSYVKSPWEARTYEFPKSNGRFDNDKGVEIMEIESDKSRKVQNDRNMWGRLNARNGYYDLGNFPENHRPTYDPVKFKPDAFLRTRSMLPRQIPAEIINYGNAQLPNYAANPASKGSEFTMANNFQGNGRFRRSSADLHALLDEEMIKEDDANSKDCNCRVIRENARSCDCRSKRNVAVESLESHADAETIPAEAMGVDLNRDIAHGELRQDSDVEIFTELRGAPIEKVEPEPRSESLSPKMARNASSQIGSNFENVPKVRPLGSRLDSSGNRENWHSLVPSANVPSSLKERKNSGDPEKLFHEWEEEKEEEKAPINTENHSASDKVDSGTIVEEKIPGEKEKAEKAEALSGQSPSATGKATALSEETIRQESENNYDNSDAAVEGSSKREARLVDVTQETPVKVEAAKLPRNFTETRKQKGIPKRKTNADRPRESRGSRRAKALRALRDLLRQLKQSGVTVSAPKLKSVNRVADYQRAREDQVQKLKEKLRKKRQMMLQRYEKSVRDMVEGEEDEERRNLKRREAWQVIKESDDFRDMVDREKLAYILMHQPPKNAASNEEIEKIEVPVTEIVRAQNIRQRMFNPKNQNFHGASVMEHPNPNRLREKIIQITNLNLGGRREKQDASEKSYFALVEDVKKPRFFYHRNPATEQKKSLQAPSAASFFYNTEYHDIDRVPVEKSYRESLKAAQYSRVEDQEESSELPEGREIYIIDPTEYKGGDPPLRFYRGPSKSRSNTEIATKNAYEIVLQPVSYKPLKQRKRTPEGTEDAQGNGGELLKNLVDNLDTRTAGELLRRLTGHNVTGNEKENFMRSIMEEKNVAEVKEEEEEEEEEEEDAEEKELEEGRGNSRETSESPKATDTPRQQRESYQPNLNSMSEEDIIPEVIIPHENARNNDNSRNDSTKETGHRRDRREARAGVSNEEYFKWLSSFLMRKAPRENLRTGRNYLYLKESSEEAPSSEETARKLFRIVKGNEYYKVVPVRKMYGGTSADLRGRIVSPKQSRHNNEQFRKYPSFLHRLKIVIPSTSSEESMEMNPSDDAKNLSYKKLSEDYADALKYLEKEVELGGSEERLEDGSSDYEDEDVSEVQELYNTEKEEEEEEESLESNEEANLKEALLYNKPQVLMVLPWGRRPGRVRREAEDRKREIDGNRNTEKVQQSELQHLDESLQSSTPTFSPIDDVEKSLIQKIPLEKFTAKENINRKKNIRKIKKQDDGLSSLIEKSIPTLGNVVVDGLKKAENFTGSVGELIENLDEDYNKTTKMEARNSTDVKPIDRPARNVFHNAIVNVKKFFMLLSGVTHLFRG